MVDCQWEFSHKVPGTSFRGRVQRAEGEREGKRGQHPYLRKAPAACLHSGRIAGSWQPSGSALEGVGRT